MMRYSPLNCLKELVRRYWLGENILGTRLYDPHRGRNIGVTCKKHDRQGRAELANDTGAPHRSVPVSVLREEYSQAHSRWAYDPANSSRLIGYDLVASFLQTTFDCCSEK